LIQPAPPSEFSNILPEIQIHNIGFSCYERKNADNNSHRLYMLYETLSDEIQQIFFNVDKAD